MIWYGIDLIINIDLPFFFSSNSISPLILNDPLPLLYPCLINSLPIIRPPVGKSNAYTEKQSVLMPSMIKCFKKLTKWVN